MNKITESKLLKNSLANYIGIAIQIVAGAISLPIITRMLTPEKFGLLSLLWAVFVYFSMFDIGLGPAITRYVSRANAIDTTETVSEYFWSAIRFQVVLGITGLIIAYLGVNFIVNHMLNLPGHLRLEARNCFYIVSVCIPFILLISILKGMLEAYQRFDLVNYIQIPIAVIQYASPIIATLFKRDLATAVSIILFSRILGVLVYFLLIIKLHPEILNTKKMNYAYMKDLLRYGGWLTIGSLLSPILVQSDRFIIGTYCSLAVVGFYTVAIDTATRLLAISRGIVPVIFPMVSAAKSVEEIVLQLEKGLMAICYTSIPIFFLLTVFSKELFTIWLGPQYGVNSSMCFSIALLGIYSCLLSQIPLTALQATGYPKIVAIIYIIEIPFFLVMLFPVIKYEGYMGAIIMWTARLIVEMILLFYFFQKIIKPAISKCSIRKFWIGQICFILVTFVCYVVIKTIDSKYHVSIMIITSIMSLLFYMTKLKRLYWEFRH